MSQHPDLTPEPPDAASISDAAFVFTSNFLTATASATKLRARAPNKRVDVAFRDLTRQVSPTVSVEIGAFEAGFSTWVKDVFPDCRVIAYEANPYTHEMIRETVAAAGVEYVNACIGAESGTVTLNVPRDFKGKSFGLAENQMASLQLSLVTEEHEQVQVPSLRLSDAVPLSPEDCLVAWIDVEGALEHVLAGSRQTLSRARVVFVEVEDSPLWEGQWLDTDVYRWFASIGKVPVLRDMQRPGQYNVIFVDEDLARDPQVAQRAARVYVPPEPGSPDRLENASKSPDQGSRTPRRRPERALRAAEERSSQLERQVAAMETSRSWRLTRPMRALGAKVRRSGRAR